jgi:hypothetical protein
MEAVYSPETFVIPYKTIWCDLEDGCSMDIRIIEPVLQDYPEHHSLKDMGVQIVSGFGVPPEKPGIISRT